MPRSSGGGHHHSSHRSSHRSSSHRSSSHRSSSSHHYHHHHRSSSYYGSGSGYSSSGRVNLNRISSSFFPGARRYSYTRFGKTRYIYSINNPAEKFRPARLLVLLFYIPFILALGAGMVKLSPFSLKKPDSTEIIIKDEADVISSSDESELRSVMNKFYKKSGVVPAVITIDEEKWENANSLEDYAYTRYLSEFTDEMHWLIVYSNPADGVDWYFEGMQGNDTVNIITYNVADTFDSRLTVNLDDEGSEVGSSISNAFEYVMPLVRKTGLSDILKTLAPAWFVFLFLGIHAFIMSGISDLKYKKAKYDPDPDEANQLASNTAAAAAGIAQNYGTGVDMSRAYPQNGYQNYGAQTGGYTADSYNSYSAGGSQNGGYMQEIGVPGTAQTQGMPGGQSGYQTQYGANSNMQDAYMNSNAQNQNSSYGQTGYQNYGSQNSGGYGTQQNTYGNNGYMNNAYGQEQSYGTQNSAAADYQSYGSSPDGDMPEIGLPQPVPPGCTTCSSCGNVYHISDGRCPLCGGR